VSKLEEFVASLPSRKTSELLRLLAYDKPYGSTALFQLVASDSNNVGDMWKAESALRAEIDIRLPPRHEAR
jgi:hypothetical protein